MAKLDKMAQNKQLKWSTYVLTNYHPAFNKAIQEVLNSDNRAFLSYRGMGVPRSYYTKCLKDTSIAVGKALLIQDYYGGVR